MLARNEKYQQVLDCCVKGPSNKIQAAPSGGEARPMDIL